ncbi:hypothetical protein HPB51_017163 [Rhipicephalus microplus]|uniref:Uncharacterized protein n=1 Tax=Rhipicephalus microplus TaxID=6941 RepID=A0A9J6DPD9_RHIMP|nr:hypothetical protein HPB51_017163 [Rhipicephalus microplus]
MASNHRFSIMQNLLTLLIAWSAVAHVCSWEIVMKLPPSYGPDNRVGDKIFYNFTATDGLYFKFPAASTSPTPPVVYLSTRRIDLPSSGHGNSALCMASNHRFSIMQLCTKFSLYAKKSDDPFLQLFPCPKVLYEVLPVQVPQPALPPPPSPGSQPPPPGILQSAVPQSPAPDPQLPVPEPAMLQPPSPGPQSRSPGVLQSSTSSLPSPAVQHPHQPSREHRPLVWFKDYQTH